MSLLPEKIANQQYGFFGYEGAMCDRAIRADSAPMLQECVDRGFIDADTPVIGFKNALDFCERRGFSRCADVLRKTKVTA